MSAEQEAKDGAPIPGRGSHANDTPVADRQEFPASFPSEPETNLRFNPAPAWASLLTVLIAVHGVGYWITNSGHVDSPALTENQFQVDINHCSADELMALPMIGPRFAQRIIDFRQTGGPFQQVDDLLQVNGMGAVKLERLRPWLRSGHVDAASPKPASLASSLSR